MDARAKIVKHVVVDSGAFMRNAPIQNIGENVYTLPEVVREIRDHATRERLQILPYNLQFREPPTEAIRTVTEFAKKTGDYQSLSAVDIKVMALTYQLEKETVGIEHIKQIPEKKAVWTTSGELLEKPSDIAGFYLSTKKSQHRTAFQPPKSLTEMETLGETKGCPSQSHDSTEISNDEISRLHMDKSEAVCQQMDGLDLDENRKVSEIKYRASVVHEDVEGPIETRNLKEGEILHSNLIEEYSDDDKVDEESDDNDNNDDGDVDNNGDGSDDDDNGWITPSNIQIIKNQTIEVNTENSAIHVGCLTTDFSMQNVLLQMGLKVISIDGMLIKRANSYVLRCFACSRVTSNMSKEFCPHCGNSTLQRVSMAVEEDGTIKYFLSRRKLISTRGTKFSLPAPKGGKHAKNPILCEDQPRPHQREAKKTQQKMNVFGQDYVAGTSPFALKDTTSRASQLGIRSNNSGSKRNTAKKHYSKRK